MNEARAVIDRLDRIETLERQGADPATLLNELRGLVRDAEAWARLEGDSRAQGALDATSRALDRVSAPMLAG